MGRTGSFTLALGYGETQEAAVRTAGATLAPLLHTQAQYVRRGCDTTPD